MKIWISSSTKEVVPITCLDGEFIADGKPGQIWEKMDSLYQQFKQNGAA